MSRQNKLEMEENIAKLEKRQANFVSKSNVEKLRAELDESVKLDRLLDALTAKAKVANN